MDAALEKIRAQVRAGLKRRNIEFVRAAFESHKDIGKNAILASSLGAALGSLDIRVDSAEIGVLLKSRDLNDDGGLDFEEFSSLVSTPSSLEEWVRGLQLNQLVADTLPRADCPTNEQLRHLSQTTPKQLEASCEIIKEMLFKTLQENTAALKESFEKLDRQAAAESNSKFQISKMSVGNIADFHDGLASRIGEWTHLLLLQI